MSSIFGDTAAESDVDCCTNDSLLFFLFPILVVLLDAPIYTMNIVI